MRLTLIIVSVAVLIALTISVVFVITNEKGKTNKSNEQLDEMKVSLQKMEAEIAKVNQESEGIDKQKEREDAMIEINEQKTINKIESEKPSIIEDVTEKDVSCVLLDGSVEDVTAVECEVLKNKDVMRKEINDSYDECSDEAEDDFEDCLESNKKRTMSSSKIYGESEIAQVILRCSEIYDRDSKSCERKRDEGLYKVK